MRDNISVLRVTKLLFNLKNNTEVILTETIVPELSKETQALVDGGVIVYPTEAVWGIGCDPKNQSAVETLLQLKNRPMDKGLILIANDYGQLLPFVADNKIPMHKRADIFSRWPGPVTWLLPAAEDAPVWVTGGSDLIAVRVTDHPTVKRICREFGGPIVSTSANITGQPTPETISEVETVFGTGVTAYVDEALGGNNQPSQIIHGFTGEVMRS